MSSNRGRNKKSNKTQSKHGENERSRSSSPEQHEMQDGGAGRTADGTDLAIVLRELRDFRRDNKRQLEDIKEEIKKTNTRMDEAETRIVKAEERIQNTEDVTSEMLKLLAQFDAKIIDQDCRSRRESVRIYGVSEGKESDATTMNDFVEKLLQEGLGLPSTEPLQIQRSHRSLGPKPPAEAPPRSIVAKFLSYKTKELVLKTAWQKKGFTWQDDRINLDHDHPPRVLQKRRDYAEARSLLKDRQIPFKTLHPARLRVDYNDGTKIYDTAEDATQDMEKRGFPIAVIQTPETLMERLRQLTWQKSTRRGNRRAFQPRPSVKIRDKLQPFVRRETPPPPQDAVNNDNIT